MPQTSPQVTVRRTIDISVLKENEMSNEGKNERACNEELSHSVRAKRWDELDPVSNWKKVDAAVEAAFQRLRIGRLPHHRDARMVIEPYITESGEGIFMCDFSGGRAACKSCGGKGPGDKGCFSVSVPPHLYGLTMTPQQIAHRSALAEEFRDNWKSCPRHTQIYQRANTDEL
jgi:hypothetical protein